MATFANQASNFSVLESKFNRLLNIRNISDESDGDRHRIEKKKSTEAFFISQINRIENVEKELSLATGCILLSSRQSKTITELAELCRLSQNATREKLEELKLCLENEGYTVTPPGTASLQAVKLAGIVSSSSPSLNRNYNRRRTMAKKSIKSTHSMMAITENSRSNEEKNCQTSLPFITNIGGPLEIVLEADYETDGLPTPKSYLESPVLSSPPSNLENEELVDNTELLPPTVSTMNEKMHYWQKSLSFVVPSPDTPPTLDELSMSANTNSLLQNIQIIKDNVEDKPCVSHGSLHNTFSSNEICCTEDSSKRSIVKTLNISQQQEQRQHHLQEFLDDDDMITLDTQSTITKNFNLSSPTLAGETSNENQISAEKRSHFIANMEGMLERVEEIVLEESPSRKAYFQNGLKSRYSNKKRIDLALVAQKNEDIQPNSTSGRSTSSREKTLSQSRRNASKIFYENESKSIGDNCVLNISKDSTNVVATQVAEEDVSKDGNVSLVPNKNKVGNRCSLDSFHQRPTHILVDTRLPSPTHMNITMDAAFMNETNEISFEEGREQKKDDPKTYMREISGYDTDDDDNISTLTPILDRYRLDPTDENSVGVKVVPNKRSAHRTQNKQPKTPRRAQLPTIAQLSPPLEFVLRRTLPEKSLIESTFMSPEISSSKDDTGALTADASLILKRKVYRKTPFPKRKLLSMEDVGESDSITNENENLNNFSPSSLPDSPESLKKDERKKFISVPPLRPSSYESGHLDESILHTGAKNIQSIKKRDEVTASPEASVPSICSGKARQMCQEETDTIQKIDRTIERINLELTPSIRIGIGNCREGQAMRGGAPGYFVREITTTEFESAPRIVRANVSRDRANLALYAIKKHCSESMIQFHNFEFTEKEGYDMVGFSEQENKSILVSLCHWRRLTMKKDKIRGMVFMVNNEK